LIASSRLTALALVALLPAAACAVPRLAPPTPTPTPTNPFAGTWSAGERQQIGFREATVVISSGGAPPTPLSAATCDGTFRFGYGRESRAALLGLPLHQPDLQRQLAAILTAADYPVAEAICGEGGTVYVLLDQHDLLAIHRDRDVAGVERLTRL
jgi:hypothetical protein